MRLRFLFLALGLAAGGHAAAAPDCSYDEAALMSLSPRAFNDDADRAGWRGLADREACIAAAADLLKNYRLRQMEGPLSSVLHHEAQLRAATGQTEEAVQLLRRVLDIAEDDASKAYHKAEIAFIEQDFGALVSARDELLAVPMPEGFEQGVEEFKQKYPDYPPPVWPTNLNVVEGFIACFDEPYSVAYSEACGPEGAE